jgi:hypothetical protein
LHLPPDPVHLALPVIKGYRGGHPPSVFHHCLMTFLYELHHVIPLAFQNSTTGLSLLNNPLSSTSFQISATRSPTLLPVQTGAMLNSASMVSSFIFPEINSQTLPITGISKNDSESVTPPQKKQLYRSEDRLN